MNALVRGLDQECKRELHLVRDWLNTPTKLTEGSYLWHMFMAFAKADQYNFRLMAPVVRKLIKKYEVRCTCTPRVKTPKPVELNCPKCGRKGELSKVNPNVYLCHNHSTTLIYDERGKLSAPEIAKRQWQSLHDKGST